MRILKPFWGKTSTREWPRRWATTACRIWLSEDWKPWAVMAMLSMPKPTGGMILDMVLNQRAQANGKPVSGLETMQEQLSVFENLSLEDQITLLEMTLNQADALPAMFRAVDPRLSGRRSDDDRTIGGTVFDQKQRAGGQAVYVPAQRTAQCTHDPTHPAPTCGKATVSWLWERCTWPAKKASFTNCGRRGFVLEPVR